MKNIFIFTLLTLSQLSHSALQLTDNEPAFKRKMSAIIKRLPICSRNKQTIYAQSYDAAQACNIKTATLINTLISYAAINTFSNLKTCCTVCKISLTEAESALYEQQLSQLNMLELDLMRAVKVNDVSRVEECLNKGARINVQVACGDAITSPLLLATQRGYTAIVRLLLTQPTVDVNIQDTKKFTPLMIALALEYPAIALLLVNHPGINTNLTNMHGKNAGYLAIKKGYCLIPE